MGRQGTQDYTKEVALTDRFLGGLVVIGGLVFMGFAIRSLSNQNPADFKSSFCLFIGLTLVLVGLGIAVPRAQVFLLQILRIVADTVPYSREKQKDLTSEDEKLDLPAEESEEPEIEETWQRVRELRVPILDLISPTYLLDDTYHLLDWNPAFDEVFAKEMRLVRSRHASTIIKHLANAQSVVERSQKRFAPGEVPLVDIELLEYDSHRFGFMKLEKIAAQIPDSEGRTLAWSVNLNVLDCEKGAELWSALEERLKTTVNWTRYAESYDRLLLEFDEYVDLMKRVLDNVGNSRLCLDIGAGTGNGAIQLLESNPRREVWAIENNEAMLHHFNEKLASRPEISSRCYLIKEDATRLERIPKNHFDAAIMVNVLYALDNKDECLSQIFDRLVPGGVLSLSTSHSDTDLQRLFARMKQSLESKGLYEKLRHCYEDARNRNYQMEKQIHEDSIERTVHYLEDAGFIVQNQGLHYVDAVVVLKAQKPF